MTWGVGVRGGTYESRKSRAKRIVRKMSENASLSRPKKAYFLKKCLKTKMEKDCCFSAGGAITTQLVKEEAKGSSSSSFECRQGRQPGKKEEEGGRIGGGRRGISAQELLLFRFPPFFFRPFFTASSGLSMGIVFFSSCSHYYSGPGSFGLEE